MSETGSGKSERIILTLAIFSVAAAVAYWLYLFISTGSAPSISSLWSQATGAITGMANKQSYSDLVTLATNAGFSGDDANTAAAIALAESSGNPNAVGDLNITPGGSIGLWQINLKAHPEYTAEELKDPQTNANAAFAVYNEQGWGAWSTYNSGAYEAYLQNSSTTQTADASTDTQDTSTDTTASGGTVAGASGGTVNGGTDTAV